MLTQTRSTTSLAYFKTEVKFDYLTAINMSSPLGLQFGRSPNRREQTEIKHVNTV